MDSELALAIHRFDLRGYVLAKGGEKEGRHEFLMDCPRCGRQKLAVNVRVRRWHCFTCEKLGPPSATGRRVLLDGGGGVFALIVWVERMAPAEAARFILDAAVKVQPVDGLLPDTEFQVEVPHYLKQPTGLPENTIVPDAILPYMHRRGITLEDVRTFGIGWVPPGSGWLSNRLVFPVWERGVCLYWQARACWDEHEHVPRWPGKNSDGEEDKFRKSLNPSSERKGIHYFGSGDVVGNVEQAARFPRVCMVEGPTSGIRVGSDAVWTFGKQLQPAQLARILAAGIRAVDLMWDGPSPKEPRGAWDRMAPVAAMMSPFLDVRLVYLPQGDPANYTREQCNWFRSRAVPFGQHTGLI